MLGNEGVSKGRKRPPPRHSSRKLSWLLGLMAYLSGFVSFHLFHIYASSPWDSSNVVQFHQGAFVPCQENDPLPIRKSQVVQSLPSTPKWAYAFLVSGCDPSSPFGYRPYFWNILVAAKNLKESGSQADIVVMVQMAKQKDGSYATELPARDLQWLQLYNDTITIHYLPPLLRDNFYNAQLAKFHILELTKYSRVLYLDADVMPLCSLDYLFRLSEEGKLQPNVVLAWFTEPSHGGFFLLTPGKYAELQAVIRRREEEALQLPYPHWDPVRGWGAALDEEWFGLVPPHDSNRPQFHSINWTFHGDFADQGLLYFWTRFHEQAVSILHLDEIEEYRGGGGRRAMRKPISSVLQTPGCLPEGMEVEGQYGSTLHDPLFVKKVPHRDFLHFSGDQKPWEVAYQAFPQQMDQVHSSTDFWYYQLGKVFEDFEHKYSGKLPSLPLKHGSPSLGRYPTHRSMIGTIQKRLRVEAREKNMTGDGPAP
eukprot:Nitzschia sp. Nitz4//scaffold73_size107353//79856//81295//NITZ4_004329-RA/size107353-processed-gene-0.197-mRNA-1//-1//CDS//3329557503//8342//frame0